MIKSNIIADLEQRGFIHDITDKPGLNALLNERSTTFYCGFDPTADSLHVGSLLPLLVMRRLQDAGHLPIAIMGGGTGMIGDPSGRSEERKLMSTDVIENNIRGIENQIRKILRFDIPNSCKIVSNLEWLGKLSLIEFLRDTGKHFTVNMMLAKESVRSRLEDRDQGISFTEFSYMLLQAFDFYYLYQHYDCRLQIGGSDQWGNITAGNELIRRRSDDGEKAKAFGLTIPLLTTSTGAKFGKTEQGAVWLDAKRTSPYRFYQYWLNTADADAIRFLKLFSFLDLETIQQIEKDSTAHPEKRLSQRRLAAEVTNLLHGQDETVKAERASEVLFGGELRELDAATLQDIFSDVPSSTIASAELSAGIGIQDLLVKAKLADSKGAARRLIESGGAYVNNAKASSPAALIKSEDCLDGGVIVLRSGKKNFHLLKVSAS